MVREQDFSPPQGLAPDRWPPTPRTARRQTKREAMGESVIHFRGGWRRGKGGIDAPYISASLQSTPPYLWPVVPCEVEADAA